MEHRFEKSFGKPDHWEVDRTDDRNCAHANALQHREREIFAHGFFRSSQK